MIPKIIHYCWFGGNAKPKEIEKYIQTWRSKLTGYKFIEWNEKNFDITNSIPYVKEAYEAKKYAFVSDYVRLHALNEYGGIYFDTDIEVLKSFDNFLQNEELVLCRECRGALSTAFIACCKNNAFISEFLDSYKDRHFIKRDGQYDMSTINEHMSQLAADWGVDLQSDDVQIVENSLAVYPYDYFSAFDVKNWHPVITENTCTVHHMTASWFSSNKKIVLIKFFQKLLGYKNYDRIKAWLDRQKES